MEVIQLRFDDGSIQFVETIKKALNEAERDFSLWKISFSLGNERIRLVRRTGTNDFYLEDIKG